MTTEAQDQPSHPDQDTAPASALAERLDIITRLARRLFRVPVVSLSLMKEGKLKLFAAQGVP